ncbi:steroidogenic acute regulatory protein-like [Eurytemora carolleeae]|uniref:steroidogenic acute regulatory protein-like n=1 Tax=Eurytemora carolleeae TaxID=1294199 RepID=UPI000C7747CC|nr:steroidogenic acute regulatory protein-like [Eurytemora carolleeae]XP_023321326.1 steroidogenic acute regulatory protein-like [Eurytemora carolleeae]XP_023321327.1 steroidogenic acute regulatory protein-like [Eurytemora carolleeae]|eukprot:XP_023321325.1 steroidogenic acute regulatory protein-like [Eurytemora affinis]
MSTDAEYIAAIEEAWEEGLELANSTEGWKKEKEDKDTGDLVEVKKNGKGKKIYRCRGRINMPRKLLEEALSDTDNVKSWNNTLTEAKLLKKLNDTCAISYQITTEAAGGMVSARDFVYGSKIGRTANDAFVMGGKSVDYPDAPKNSKIVRAVNGPGCQIVYPVEGKDDECDFVWLMDCEYKGWMPGSILDVAMPMAQTQFIECIRKLAAKRKSEGRF